MEGEGDKSFDNVSLIDSGSLQVSCHFPNLLTEMTSHGLATGDHVRVALGCGLMTPHPATLTGRTTSKTVTTALSWSVMGASNNMNAIRQNTSSARKVFYDKI